MTTVDLAPAQTADEPFDSTRRRALLGMAVAVGAACAGCASSPSDTASAGAPSSTAGSAAAGGSASGDGTSSAPSSTVASSSTDTASSAPLAAASAVPVGGGTVLSAQKIVLTQPTAGTFKAFSAICTHQGCLVGSVQNGLIVCPCHGSSYRIADGSVVSGPAAQPLAPVAVKVAGGEIVPA